MVKLNFKSFLDGKNSTEKIFKSYASKIETLNSSIDERKCKGASMLEWIDYPSKFNKNEIKELINLSSEWHNNKKIKNVVMLGIGGSYIGVRAGIDWVLPEFNREKEIHYVSSMSSSYISSLIEKLKKEDFYLIVISKSGTTLEVGVSFRLFYSLLFEKFGSEGAKERTVAITDKEKGTLKKIADNQGIRTFSIPDDVGGRFSAITPVGLFAMGVMGLDVSKVLKGCAKAIEDTKTSDINKNTAYQYAALRHYMHTKKEKHNEVYCVYEDALRFFTEHLKQLFAESEGKEGKGLFPMNCLFTTDLHSVGQFLQEGTSIFFETCISIKNPLNDVVINEFLKDEDGLGFLNGKKLDQINKVAASSTIDAHHIDGGVDIIQINLDNRNEESFGYLYSWFSKAVAMSGLLLKVNPFDQPGVEAYKKRMFSKLRDKA